MSQFLQGITEARGLPPSRRSPIGNAPAPTLGESAILETADAGKALPPRVVILTALAEEFLAVEQYVVNRQEIRHPDGTVYEYGRFTRGDVVWDVVIVETGQGNRRAATETQRAIGHFKPDVVLFVGVAGGRKDVKIGDVVAADKVYNYESGRDEIEFKPRPEAERSSYPLEQRARAIVRDWLRRKQEPGTEDLPAAYVGAIAAGESVVASTQSATAQRLNQNYGDALAVEKEGYGFLGAAREVQGVSALVIRGISDLLDDKENSDKQGSQRLAAHHASEFAFELLEKLAGTKNDDQSGVYDPTDPTPLPLYTTLPEGMMSMTVGISAENDFYIRAHHLKSEFPGRKRNIDRSLLALPQRLDGNLNANNILGEIDRCNTAVKRSCDCVAGQLLAWLHHQSLEALKPVTCLVIDDRTEMDIPWELLEVGESPVGATFQTVRYQQREQEAIPESTCCGGGVLVYAHAAYDGWQQYQRQEFTLFSEFLCQVQTPSSEFGLVFIDGFSIEAPLHDDPTTLIRRSKLFRSRGSIVFISGQVDLDASMGVTHHMLLTKFLDYGAKGIVGISRPIDRLRARTVVDQFSEVHRQNPDCTVPEILRQLRSNAWEALDNEVNEDTCAIYLATFSHIYYGDPLTVLRLLPQGDP
jgi:nucleoside phosphorylase